MYTVKEIFITLQGEGYWSGSKALFVRFSGCNIWSGRPETREKDSAKGLCAKWCDTDFVGTNGINGGKYTVEQLVAKCNEVWTEASPKELICSRRVVFTGGEPSLQLGFDLVQEFKCNGWFTHVETNGYKVLPSNLDWICLSPKPPLMPIKQRYDEVKVPYNGTDETANPLEYAEFANHKFIQPLDLKDDAVNLISNKACIEFIMQNPEWRVTLQTHKYLNLP